MVLCGRMPYTVILCKQCFAFQYHSLLFIFSLFRFATPIIFSVPPLFVSPRPSPLPSSISCFFPSSFFTPPPYIPSTATTDEQRWLVQSSAILDSPQADQNKGRCGDGSTQRTGIPPHEVTLQLLLFSSVQPILLLELFYLCHFSSHIDFIVLLNVQIPYVQPW